MKIDIERLFDTLGGVAKALTMCPEAGADALEHYLEAEPDRAEASSGTHQQRSSATADLESEIARRDRQRGV